MKNSRLENAISEAQRFLDRARTLLQLQVEDEARVKHDGGPANCVFSTDFRVRSGAVRRASMDLTRALADLRKPDHL